MAIELTPTQIQRTDFPISKKGYDVDAVRAHLRDAAAALENALRRAKLAEDRARRAEEALAQAQQAAQAAAVPEKQLAEETERVLRTARESAASIEEEARRKAEEVMAQAQQNAASLVAEAEARARQAEENAQRILAEAQQAADSAVVGKTIEEAKAEADRIVREAEAKARALVEQAEQERSRVLKELEAKAQAIEERRKKALAELEARRQQALRELEAKKAELKAERAVAGPKKKKIKTKSGRIVSGVVDEAREVAEAAGRKSGPVAAALGGGDDGGEAAEAAASVEEALAAASSSRDTVEAKIEAGTSTGAPAPGGKFDEIFSRFKQEPDTAVSSGSGELAMGSAAAGASAAVGAGAPTSTSGPVPATEAGPVSTPVPTASVGGSGPVGVAGSVDTEAMLSGSVEIPLPAGAEIDLPEAQSKIVVVLRKQLVRKLKRALQDEQNVVVESIQKAGGRGSAEALVPAAADMLRRVRAHTDTVLFELSKLGWSVGGGGDSDPPAVRFEAIVGPRLVDPLRSQLVAAAAEGLRAGDDVSALCERVHNVFRVWKGPELADLAAYLAHEAFMAGKGASVRG